MNPVPDLKSESTLDTGENDSAKDSSLDDYHGISTSHQPFDPSAYFDNYAFDDVFFQGLKGYESYHFGLGYGSPSTLISSPSAYPTSVTSLPSGTDHEFPFRTRTGSQIPQPMDAMPSPSTNSLNESFPSPSQSFGPSKETGSGVGAPVQTVRNSQLEKRRAQNRNSQRAFRERKESYTNYLERELLCLREKYDTALRCLYRLRAACAAIESLDRFDVAFNERGMGVTVEELKKEVEKETQGAG